jgi:hypothetical protein
LFEDDALGRNSVRRSPEDIHTGTIGRPIERLAVAPISATFVVTSVVQMQTTEIQAARAEPRMT